MTLTIAELYSQGQAQGKPLISCEVFPPNTAGDLQDIYWALGHIASLQPAYISVTYGAGGGGNTGLTAQISSAIEAHQLPSLAHLVCVGATKDGLAQTIEEMKAQGIRNILALRGDLAPGVTTTGGPYQHAEDLICELRRQQVASIGAACYPEGHIECDNLDLDTQVLVRKQEAGAHFAISQLFFDNSYFYQMLDRVRPAGVSIPISAGLMPIVSQQQISRMIFMCGVSLPSSIIRLLHKYQGDAASLRAAGIDHAVSQAADLLAQGVDGIHLYTMNKPDIAQAIMSSLSTSPSPSRLST